MLQQNATCLYLDFYSSTASDAFNVLFYNAEGGTGTYYRYPLYVTKSGWQEVAIPVSDIAVKVPVKDIKSFILQKGGWGISKDTENGFNSQNKLYFDSMWFENRAVTFIDFTDTTSETLPMHNAAASNDGGRMKKDANIYYGDSRQSGLWSVTGSSSTLSAYNVPSSVDLDAAAKCDAFIIRFYASTAKDAFSVLFYAGENATGTYYRYPLYVTKSGWQEVAIPVSDIAAKVPVKDIKSFNLNKGGWGIKKDEDNGFNAQNKLYFDSMWFESASDFNASFEYTASVYSNAEDVGVYDTITLEFSEAISGTIACDAVEVKKNGNAVTEFTAWADGERLCVKTDTAMAFNSSYEITVTPALESRRGYTLKDEITISFTTKSPYFAIDDIRLVDSEGNRLSKLPGPGTDVSATAEIINGSDENEETVLIIAMYDKDNRLVDVQIGDVQSHNANMAVPKSYSISKKVTVTDDTASIRGFLWSALDTIIPCKEMEYIN